MGFSSRLVGALFGVAAVISGCGSEDDGGGGAAGITAETFSQAFQSALCDGMATCCSGAGRAYVETSCKIEASRLAQLYSARSTDAAFEFDAAQAERCLVRVKQRTATCGASVSTAGETTVPCEAVYRAKGSTPAPPGQPCKDDAACAVPDQGVRFCDGTACVAVRRGAIGDSCSASITASGAAILVGQRMGQTADCHAEDGLYCDPATGKCAALIDAGQPCGDVAACKAGNYCDNMTCAAGKADSEACTSELECASAYCDFTAGQCASSTQVALGKACGQPGQVCADGSCRDGVCVPANSPAGSATCGS